MVILVVRAWLGCPVKAGPLQVAWLLVEIAGQGNLHVFLGTLRIRLTLCDFGLFVCLILYRE